MALFPKFPYLNFHELNLDWIIEQVKANKDKIEKIESVYDPVIINLTVPELESHESITVDVTVNKSAYEILSLIKSTESQFTPTIRLKAGTIAKSYIMSAYSYDAGLRNTSVIVATAGDYTATITIATGGASAVVTKA